MADRSVLARVNPGVCGLESSIQASCADGIQVVLCIESDCPRVQRFAEALEKRPGGALLDAFDEVLRKPLVETIPARLAAECGLHPTCPMPISVLKACEAAAGLALPRDCSIELVSGGEGGAS